MTLSSHPDDDIQTVNRLQQFLLASGSILVLVGVFLWVPGGYLSLACPFKELTGCSCFTCGLSRSVHAAAHGQIIASLQFHLMGPLIFAGMVFTTVVWMLEAAIGRRITIIAKRNVRRRALSILAVIWILYWGVRISGELGVLPLNLG